MKRFLTISTVLAPALLLLFLMLQPELDLYVFLPIFHFYLVTFTSFAAAVISILLIVALGDDARPRLMLASMAFVVIGLLFFTHGLATEGAIIDYNHPALRWSAWLMFFGGGLLFVLASFDDSDEPPSWLHPISLFYTTLVILSAYFVIALFFPRDTHLSQSDRRAVATLVHVWADIHDLALCCLSSVAYLASHPSSG